MFFFQFCLKVVYRKEQLGGNYGLGSRECDHCEVVRQVVSARGEREMSGPVDPGLCRHPQQVSPIPAPHFRQIPGEEIQKGLLSHCGATSQLTHDAREKQWKEIDGHEDRATHVRSQYYLA